MSRAAWIGFGSVFIVLLAVLLWPSGEPAAGPEQTWSIVDDRPTASWTLQQAEFEQLWHNQQPQLITVNGYQRPVDSAAVDRMWNLLLGLRTTVEPQAGVDPTAISAWGINDGAPRLQAVVDETVVQVDLRWAHKEDHVWMYDGVTRKLYRLPAAVIERLDAVTGRLDRQQLLELSDQPQRLRVDDVDVTADGGTWLFTDSDRPEVTGRARQWLSWLRALPCTDLRPAAALVDDPQSNAPGELVLRVMVDDQELRVSKSVGQTADQAAGDWTSADGSSQLLSTELETPADAGSWWVQHADLPPQPLPSAMVDGIAPMVAMLAVDYAYDRGGVFEGLGAPVDTIVVQRFGAEDFLIERAGMDDADPDGDSQWTVRWSGGLEIAEPTIGYRYLSVVQRAQMIAAHPHSEPMLSVPEPQQAGDVTIRLHGPGYSSTGLWLALQQGQLITRTHRGQAGELSELVSAPRPGQSMDRRLVSSTPERIEAVQRAWHAPDFRAEVFRRDRGSWSVREITGTPTAPQIATTEPISAAAVYQLAAELAMAVAQRVDLAPALAADIRSDPSRRELAIRVAALEDADAADLDRIESTISREVGLVFRRSDEQWQAAEADGVFVYELTDEQVERWFADLGSRTVLPIGPSRMREIRINRPGQDGFTLELRGDLWWVVRASGQEYQAEQAAVRAYLLALATTQWLRFDQEAAPLAHSGTISGTIIVISPGFGLISREQTKLVLGRPDQRGEVAASIDLGQMMLPASVLPSLLPSVEAFVPADADLSQ